MEFHKMIHSFGERQFDIVWKTTTAFTWFAFHKKNNEVLFWNKISPRFTHFTIYKRI